MAEKETQEYKISIHAPPRGATEPGEWVFTIKHISIHAPPRGATRLTVLLQLQLQFQFTPLREGRPPEG